MFAMNKAPALLCGVGVQWDMLCLGGKLRWPLSRVAVVWERKTQAMGLRYHFVTWYLIGVADIGTGLCLA